MKEDKGFTLVEILAALVILGIVFVGFMTVFLQMTLFNEKTDDKLVTMNLAKQELAEMQNNPGFFDDKTRLEKDAKNWKYNYDKNNYIFIKKRYL